MAPSTAQRRNHTPDISALVTALHDLHAYGARSVSVRAIQRHSGNWFTSSNIGSLASANTTLVTDNGDGTFKLTDAGLVRARQHSNNRSWST
jgi:hypothetical protein